MIKRKKVILQIHVKIQDRDVLKRKEGIVMKLLQKGEALFR